jgi:DNA repair exonuclease SbcCD nuclease subunit
MKNNNFNVLNIADIHFGKKNDKKLYNDLNENFLKEIPNIIKEYDHLNMVVIEGDLFDRVIKMTEASANYVLRFVTELCELSKKYNFYLRIINGTKSHDNNQLNNFSHLEVKYPLFKIFRTVSTEIISIPVGKNKVYDYSILYLPEEYPENYSSYYNKFLNPEENYDMIFGHGMIDFVAFTGNEEDKKKLKRNESVHSVDALDNICNYFTIFGHIHDKKNYKDEDKIIYVGSFERFSFADQEDKGFLLTTINPETGDTEAIFYENKNASVYKIININDYNFETTEEKLEFIENEKTTCDYLKVIISKDEDNKDLLKGVLSSDIKIETHNDIPEDVVDERFNFLFKKELPIDKSIAKYIELTTGKKVSTEVINKLISNADSV